MKKIAILFDNDNKRIDCIVDVLANEYEVIKLNGFDFAKKVLETTYDDLSALIIDEPSNKTYLKDILDIVSKRNNYMFSLPVLLLSDIEHMSKDDKYLESPVMGLISTSDTKKVILKRIEGAIRLSNSTSFDEFSNMLTVLPSLLYLKDAKGRYAFCSQHWHHLTNKHESLRGKTDFDIRKDKNNAEIARKSDLEVINSGIGKSYIIKEVDEEGTDYLQVIKEPVKNDKGEIVGIIAIINNVTNEELLRQQLREKSITDQLTGLYNRAYFEELTHWSSQDLKFPLTIISADCDNLKEINDKFGHSSGDQYICYAKEALKRSLPDDSIIFRMGGDEFLAVVPSTNEAKAKEYVEKINKIVPSFKNDKFELKLSVGSFTIANSASSIEGAVMCSDQEMYRVKKEHKKDK